MMRVNCGASILLCGLSGAVPSVQAVCTECAGWCLSASDMVLSASLALLFYRLDWLALLFYRLDWLSCRLLICRFRLMLLITSCVLLVLLRGEREMVRRKG
ncbi:hypothetical protein M758_UG255800 [Ceratodon purpureus]|nr:hypothetical protein M758_UG255800 [Ceratodon purpureus]